MTPYESLIDPAEFGGIADHLRSPRSPIDNILHVRSREMLGTLTEELQQEAQSQRFPRWLLSEVVARHLTDGSIRISSRFELVLSDMSCILDPGAVPRRALCHVIYAPPFYLVHTPGLFEGTLIRPKAELRSRHEPSLKRGTRLKL